MAGVLTIDGREKRKRKKQIETSEDRFERVTMDANEAAERGMFKSERKFGKEIMDIVEELGLQLKLDRLTKNSAFSFITAILQQLRSPKIYHLLDEERKQLADQMCLQKFRFKLKKFLDNELANHPKLLEMEESFERGMEEFRNLKEGDAQGQETEETLEEWEDSDLYRLTTKEIEAEESEKEKKSLIKFMEEAKEVWEEDLEEKRKRAFDKKRGLTWSLYWKQTLRDEPGSWLCNQPTWFIQLTAWFLEMDIHIVDVLESTEKDPFEKIGGNIQNPNEPCRLKLIIGSKTNIHYQSLLMLEDPADKKSTQPSWKRTKPELKGVCPSCNWEFGQLLRHITLNKTCKGRVDQMTIDKLRTESAKRRKEKKKESKNIKESWEILEQREQRLAKKKGNMKKLRDKIQGKDEVFEMRKLARESKRKSRQKQREFQELKKNEKASIQKNKL